MNRVLMAISSSQKRAHVQRLFRSFADNEWSIEFLGWDRFGEMASVDNEANIQVRYIQKGFGSGSWKMALAIPMWIVRLLIACLYRKPPEIVYALDLDSALPCAVVSRWWGVPLVYDIRDNYLLRHRWPGPLKWVLRRVETFVMNQASVIVVVDENRVTGSLLQYSDRTVIIYNCPEDIGHPPASTQEQGVSILATGYLSESRGIGYLLDALDRFPGACAILAGRIYGDALKKRVETHPRVEHLGWIDQKEAWALGWRATVMYSCYAPTSEINRRAASNKWYDAMMAGIPIITNEEVIKSRWLREHDLGYVVPYGDVEALICVLATIRDNPRDAKEKGKRGRQLFSDQYNWSVMEQRLMSAIEDLIVH